jgi:hypothetical protein
MSKRKLKFEVGDRVVVTAMEKNSAWYDQIEHFYGVPGTLVNVEAPGYKAMVGSYFAEIQYDEDIGQYSCKTPFVVGVVRLKKV